LTTLIKQDNFNRPYLGVSYNTISQNVALLNNVAQGAFVQEVVSGSPPIRPGLSKEINYQFNGQPVNAQNELSTLIAKNKVGDNISLTVWRDGKTVDLNATLTTVPNQ